VSGGLLVAGTSSDAGKSLLVTGICRWLYRRGVRVAPFKAQNMSNNSVVALDGGEIGRAQAMQAAACGLAPSVRFNPVLLKPGSDHTSQIVLRGQAAGSVGGDYLTVRRRLAAVAFDTFAELRRGFDVIICEGAGSPAEINLRRDDFVNMGLARHAGFPVVVVGDIDRGGVFASFYGTVGLLAPEDQALVAGFVVNKFRGSTALLQPGIDTLTRLTGRPTYGILPWQPGLWLDAEDSMSYVDGRLLGDPAPPYGDQWLRVAFIRLPRISNGTDAEALAAEPGVAVRLTVSPADIEAADLVVLPGSKSTVDDLEWLRRTGLAGAVIAHAKQGKPLLGICGGFQMLGRHIHDDVESHRGSVPGLGLLPTEVTFAPEKTLTQVTGTALGEPVTGYEIHHGRVTATEAPPLIEPAEGARIGNIFATHWHGTFESDGYRRAFLRVAAALAGRTGFTPAPDTAFMARREQVIDLLGDLVEQHLDTAALDALIASGPPAGLPVLAPGAPTPPETDQAR
jgi:adenosylcobyric acid synthase